MSKFPENLDQIINAISHLNHRQCLSVYHRLNIIIHKKGIDRQYGVTNKSVRLLDINRVLLSDIIQMNLQIFSHAALRYPKKPEPFKFHSKYLHKNLIIQVGKVQRITTKTYYLAAAIKKIGDKIKYNKSLWTPAKDDAKQIGVLADEYFHICLKQFNSDQIARVIVMKSALSRMGK